ncbi:MAG TPA: hypothetical protein VEX60_07995 [Pyrinomonadaceae bacterium]|nr:hypothetical protein [Pyrinomonadaceae bacterium]
MSLKVEQILDGTSFAKRAPRIYTTGAFLVPMKVKSREKERFVWVVSDFNDDTYRSLHLKVKLSGSIKKSHEPQENKVQGLARGSS